MTPPPVKRSAEALGLAVYQPESLRAEEALDVVEGHAPDLLVVVAYGELLNRRALGIAQHGALNVHPSLLPKFRGAVPIPAAILHGDEVTGVSIMRMVRRLDAGPVLAQEVIDILPEETAGELSARLAAVAADILPETGIEWSLGQLAAVPQDEARASYTREWAKADARITWNLPAEEIVRLVRAANPWPVAWTLFNDADLRIWSAAVSAERPLGQPGAVRASGATVVVSTAAGAVELRSVQPPGKPVMDAPNWWNGLRTPDVTFE